MPCPLKAMSTEHTCLILKMNLIRFSGIDKVKNIRYLSRSLVLCNSAIMIQRISKGKLLMIAVQ